MRTRLRFHTLTRLWLSLLLLLMSAAGAAAADKVQGTFTVNGKTRILKYVYVSRAANPDEPGSNYLIVLASDADVPDGARASDASLIDLAKRGQLHAVRVMWKEGTDGLTATPFHGELEENGQPTRGGASIDLRAYDEKRLSAQIKSRPLGQEWHFNATLDAIVVPVTLTAAEFRAPVPIVSHTEDVERDTRVERDSGSDPTSMKRTLGRLGFTYDDEGFLQAVNEGSLEAVRLFLRIGMNANTTTEGMPVLMSAVLHCTADPADGRTDIVKALLAGHATVDVKDENGSTPLLWSVNVGCPTDIVRALIAAGANVNAKAKGGATPLMLAQALNRAEIVILLKAAGAKP
jgi:hypothetical protein